MQTQSLLDPKTGPAICLATTIARYCLMVELRIVRGGEVDGLIKDLASVHEDSLLLEENRCPV